MAGITSIETVPNVESCDTAHRVCHYTRVLGDNWSEVTKRSNMWQNELDEVLEVWLDVVAQYCRDVVVHLCTIKYKHYCSLDC